MKKILFLALTILSITSYSQIRKDRSIYEKILVIPRYYDTVAANLDKGIDSIGSMFYSRSDNHPYIRLGTGASRYWIKILIDGDAGGGGGSNFANTDLTFTADRTHHGAGNSLQIDDLKYFRIGASDYGGYSQLGFHQVGMSSVSMMDFTSDARITLSALDSIIFGSAKYKYLQPVNIPTRLTDTTGLSFQAVERSTGHWKTLPMGALTANSNNFANTDLTATGDRYHDFNNHSLAIDNISSLDIDAYTGMSSISAPDLRFQGNDLLSVYSGKDLEIGSGDSIRFGAANHYSFNTSYFPTRITDSTGQNFTVFNRSTGKWNSFPMGAFTAGTAGSVANALSVSAELISGGASSYNGSVAKSIAIQPTSVTNAMLAGSIASSKLVGTDIATVGTITSGTWNGTALGKTYQHSATVYNDASNTYTAGNKQIFDADATNADIRLTGHTGDPSSLANGDMWYNSTSNVYKGRFNGTTRQFGTLDGTETYTNKDLTSGTNTFPTFNQSTTGSAATLTTSRNIQGVAFNGSANIDIINGTGFVKSTGTTLSYDNSTYLTTSSASSTYQPLDADLTTIAGLTATTDNFMVGTSSAWSSRTPSQARTQLGATTVGGNIFTLTNPSAVGYIRVNADNTVTHNSYANVKTDLSLNNVDNTSDATKNSATATLTNKRWTARVGSTTSSATPTINTDNTDIYKLTAQTADITSFTTNLSGTPVDGDILEIQITGTAARAITWGASFVASTVALPTTTVTTATLTVVFQYYTTSSYGNNKWVCANSY